MNIIHRAVQYIHIYGLPDLVVVQGAVAIRNHKTGRMCRKLIRRREIRCKRRLLFKQVPHLQEQECKAGSRIPLQHNRNVLPMPEAFSPVDILIRQIDASVKGDLSVDHQDLPVIPVVIVRGNNRPDRGKRLRLNTVLLQPFAVIRRKGGYLKHTVIHHTHIHALLCFFNEQLQDAAPHIAFINDEKLQKNELFRLLQFLHHSFEHILTQRKIRHLRLVIHGKAAAPVQVFPQIVRAGRIRRQPFQHSLRLRQSVDGPADHIIHTLPDLPMPDIGLGEGQQGHAGDRYEGDDEHPGQFGGGVHPAVEQINDSGQREQHAETREERKQIPQPCIKTDRNQYLSRQQQYNEKEPAEDQMKQSFFSGLRQSVNVTHLYTPFLFPSPVPCVLSAEKGAATSSLRRQASFSIKQSFPKQKRKIRKFIHP